FHRQGAGNDEDMWMVAVSADRQDGSHGGTERLRQPRKLVLQSGPFDTKVPVAGTQEPSQSEIPVLQFGDGPKLRESQVHTGFTRHAYDDVSLLLQHDVTDGQCQAAKCPDR